MPRAALNVRLMLGDIHQCGCGTLLTELMNTNLSPCPHPLSTWSMK